MLEILQSIPSKDRKEIEFFFSYLVQRDNLGFVLFGKTKAAAFCSIPIVCQYSIVPKSIAVVPLQYQKRLTQSWAIWSRYKHRFKHPNFVVCEEYDHFKKSAFVQLIFIDKIKLKSVLEIFRGDFEEVLGKNYSTEEFIIKIEKKKKLRSLINHDDKLLGIILGFGKESSAAFKNQKSEDDANSHLTIVGHKPKGCCIVPVSFKGDPNSAEVEFLIDAYTKEIHDIESIFKSDSFLLTVLEKFCSPPAI